MLFMAGSSGRLIALSGGKQSHLIREHQSTTVQEVMQRLLLMHMENITEKMIPNRDSKWDCGFLSQGEAYYRVWTGQWSQLLTDRCTVSCYIMCNAKNFYNKWSNPQLSLRFFISFIISTGLIYSGFVSSTQKQKLWKRCRI